MGSVMDSSLLLECGRKLKHQFNLRLCAYIVIRKGKCWVRWFCLAWLRNLAGDALTAQLMGRRKTWGPRNHSDLVVHQNLPWLVWSLGLFGEFLSGCEGVSLGPHMDVNRPALSDRWRERIHAFMLIYRNREVGKYKGNHWPCLCISFT